MSHTKITLLTDEVQLVNNTEWILTKHIVIKKIVAIYAELADAYKIKIEENKNQLLSIIYSSNPKISKGENYLQLPYVLLDYPSFFTKENSLAIRTFFWWGNFFSITLHLTGVYKTQFEENIIDNLSALAKNNFFICINENQWQHHFQDDNYVPIKNNETIIDTIKNRPFIKIAYQFPLSNWNNNLNEIHDNFLVLLKLITQKN